MRVMQEWDHSYIETISLMATHGRVSAQPATIRGR